jgi:hypothetical protein
MQAQPSGGSPAGGEGGPGAGLLGSPAAKATAGMLVAALVVGAGWLAGSRRAAQAPVPLRAVEHRFVVPATASDGPAPSGSLAPAEAPAEHAQGPEVAPGAVTTHQVASRPARSSPAIAAREPEVAAAPAASEPAVSQAPSQAPSQAAALQEHRLLRAARDALATDPRRALDLTREHQRLFPKGMLAQEREVIAVEALARLGEGAAARTRADRFAAEFPDSPHQGRVKGAAAGGDGGSAR